MSKLKYIVLSDLHLGEKDSLFTSTEEGNFKMINALGRSLMDLLSELKQDKLPKLILNGDILGLSFADYNESLPIFKEFLSTFTQKNKICNDIIYIPGNHDHHIWNLTKEEQFKTDLSLSDINSIPKPISVTEPLYENGIESDFFKVFNRSADMEDFSIKVFYPNYLSKPQNEDEPFIIFHHGHYSESTYHFVSRAMKAFFPDLAVPKTLNELEASNGNWIDFAFSELGRSGKAGAKFSELMSIISDKEKLKNNIDELSDNIAAAVDFPYIPLDILESELTRTLIKNISEQVRSERYKGNTMCSDETIQGLMSYINEYCDELLNTYDLKDKPLTLVWSHTHKPFEKYTQTKKFGKLKLLNTGGWVLPPKPTPVIGAAIILVSDQNECESLRIFNDGEGEPEMHFRVIPSLDDKPSNFVNLINRSIYMKGELREPWEFFKHVLSQEIKARRNGK